MVEIDGPVRSGVRATDGPDPSPGPERRQILTKWLADHPEAVVGATTGSGLPAEVPPELDLGRFARQDRSLLDLVVPEDTTIVTEAFVAALGRGFSVVTVRLARDPNQSVLLHYVDLREDHGVVVRMLTPVGGVNGERRLGPQELVPSRPRVGFMLKDEVATIVSVDEATSLMLGWPREQMVGQRSVAFIHPEDHVRAIDNWMARRSNPASRLGTVRLRYLCQDGRWLWLETSNQFTQAADGATMVSTQLIDISSEMAASEALQRSESLLRLVTDTVPVGLFHVGPQGDVSFVNPVARRLLGGSPATNATELCSQLAPGRESELATAISGVLADGVAVSLDLEFDPADRGRRASCQVSLQPVGDPGHPAGVLGCIVDVTELKQMADTDNLTGVQSRRAVMQALAHELTIGGGHVAVVYVDLDDFKPINDRFGHGVGDRVLAAVAGRLSEAVRAGDHLGRLGGDEFLVVCPGRGGAEETAEIGRRIQHVLGAAVPIDGRELRVGASVGISCGRPGVTAEELVAEADAAMYRAKQHKGGPPVLLASWVG
jgi:diguanylate cyclase (GGDEF)-like protein/PAS domain S-box-containing protein